MKLSINVLIFLLAIIVTSNVKSQDTLSREQLLPITYTFNVEHGKLTGKGATFLSEEMSKAQFTMIGEYHGSKRISEFTNSIIPILDSSGYKTLVVEVGPISGQILNDLSSNIQGELKRINEKYLIQEEDGEVNPPIPFFENIEDAEFLEKAKNRKWNVIGIDQEYLFSYQLLIDKMYGNLSIENKSLYKKLYEVSSDSLSAFYIKYIAGEADLFESIKNSKVLKDYFSKASIEPKNVEITEALLSSNHIYWLNSHRQWFENNSTRIKYMKAQLRKQLEQNDFDLSTDKLLIKMGGYHISKGFSPLGLYEVGNTLSEIADYYGNSTLNIAFSNRFYVEDEQLIDILDSTKEYEQKLKDLDQMGKKDEWVVIDLRPMIKGHFYYPVKYKFNEHIEDLVKRYDLLIIPKTEKDPIPNHKKE